MSGGDRTAIIRSARNSLQRGPEGSRLRLGRKWQLDRHVFAPERCGAKLSLRDSRSPGPDIIIGRITIRSGGRISLPDDQSQAQRAPAFPADNPEEQLVPADAPPPDPPDSQASRYWDEYVRRHLGARGDNDNRAEWLGHPLVQERERSRRKNRGLAQWLVQQHLPHPVERMAGLGAGAGLFEIGLVQSGAVRCCDLYEVSPASIEIGRNRAEQLGLSDRVRFHRIDFNSVKLNTSGYGLVTFVSSLHHVLELEAVLETVHAALEPGGLMFAHEYVGPSRFAFPEEQTSIQRSLYRVLDPGLRRPDPELPLPDPAEVERVDPSESVRSDEILATVSRYFELVEVSQRGGAIPFVLWTGLDHDALYETPSGMQLVDLLLRLDDALLTAGTLPTYFADLVALRS